MIFDKTGTLTHGALRVAAIDAVPDYDENALLQAAAALEAVSTHPIARAIVAESARRGLATVSAIAVTTDAGRGIRGQIDGATILVGNAPFMRAHDIEPPAPTGGQTTSIFVARNEQLMGRIELGDSVRPSARATIAALSSMNVSSILVSGDTEGAVAAVAASVGIERWHASVLPIEKGEIVAELQHAGVPTGFIGDGMNDAPALARADVGFAMGGGTAVALESAHAAILSNDPYALVSALAIARGTRRAIAQNLFWAFAYNVVLIPLAAFGIVNPMFAAGAMGLSSLFVVGNSLVLARRYAGQAQTIPKT